ncbi:MAG: hypothetical protein DI570_24015 [Phenylobacterium zucineum]|nr:MAG: hypothetical protein DI570_24015 [Phenylobacterium zucineum]
MRIIPFVLAAALAAGSAVGVAGAQPQRPPVPPVVLTHMNDLDARCRAAGGRPDGGRFVFAQDFTGDGRLDYLVSEGDYVCTGKPGLFRPGGQARVDIYVADARGQVLRNYSETLIAYRLIAGQPVKVQIARRGAACGAGVAPTAQCAAQLAWNGRSFGEGVSVGAGATPAPSAPPSAAAAPVAGGESAFLARCRRAYVSADASAARWADDACKEDWKKVVASGPAAEFLLAVLSPPGVRLTLPDLRQRTPAVRWAARPAGPTGFASGKLGSLDVSVEGRSTPVSASANWAAVGQPIPYDVVEALRQRGAVLTLASCEKLGAGEGNRVFAGQAPGKAPFALTIDQREAPTASANSYYSASVSLDGRAPPRGQTADCDF